MRYRKRIVAVMLLVTASCSSRYSDHLQHGANYSGEGSSWSRRARYLPGGVQAQVTATGFVDLQGHSLIRLAAAIDSVGLTFTDGVAKLALRFRLQGSTDTSFCDTLVARRTMFRPRSPYVRRLPAAPGQYTVRVQLDDLKADSRLTRTVHTKIPNPQAPPEVGNILCEVKVHGGSWRPLAGYGIPDGTDSLRFTMRVSSDAQAVCARLLRFRADHRPARPLVSPPYRPSSLGLRGIDYEDSTIIHQSRRILPATESVQIRFRWACPRRGNYRLKVQVGPQQQAFDFGVHPPEFPAPTSPRRRAEPLIYLMRGPGSVGGNLMDEPQVRAALRKSGSLRSTLKQLASQQGPGTGSYGALMEISDRDSLQAAVKRFWHEAMGNSVMARKVADLYYRRVEQANRLFSTYKSGWKTDPGMIYILYGPPANITGSSGLWTPYFKHYSLDPYNELIQWARWWPAHSNNMCDQYFDFFQIRARSADFPFDQLLFTYRNDPAVAPTCRRAIRKQRRKWLSGAILEE